MVPDPLDGRKEAGSSATAIPLAFATVWLVHDLELRRTIQLNVEGRLFSKTKNVMLFC